MCGSGGSIVCHGPRASASNALRAILLQLPRREHRILPTAVSVDAKFDGKYYPLTGDPNIDSMAFHRVSDHEIKITDKKAGQVVGTTVVTVSKDGKTTTLKSTNYNDGKPIGHEVAVYEKTQ